MDLSMEFQSNKVCAVVFSGIGRQSVASDFTLPDYCGDIERILHCSGFVQLHTINANGDRLQADGEIEIRLLYLTDNGAPDVFEQHLPLSVSLQTPQAEQNGVLRAHASVDYLNCRALSPRKISLNGSVSVQFEVLQAKEEPIVCALPSCEALTQQITMSSLVSLQQRVFDLSETLSLPTEFPSIGKLIRVQASASVQSVEAVENKLLLKGNLNIDVVYLTQDQTFQKLQHQLPISQVLDAPGVTTDSMIDLSLEILSVYAQAKRDGADEMRLLDLAAKLNATIKAYQKKTITAITDCYALNGLLQPELAQRSFPLFFKQTLLSSRTSETIETSVRSGRLLDACVTRVKTKIETTSDRLQMTSDVTLLALVQDTDSGIHAVERTVSLQMQESMQLDAADVLFVPDLKVSVTGVQIDTDGHIHIDLNAEAVGNVFAVQQQNVLISASLQENDNQPDSQLVLYFGKTGDDLWSIAKRYQSTIALIRSENDLKDDTLPDNRLLLIPSAV